MARLSSTTLLLLALFIAMLFTTTAFAQDSGFRQVVRGPSQDPAIPTTSYQRAVPQDHKKGADDSPPSDGSFFAGSAANNNMAVNTKTPAQEPAPTMTKIPVSGPNQNSAVSAAVLREPGVIVLGVAFGMITLGMGLI